MVSGDNRRALQLMMVVCVFILLICGIYLLAEYRAESKLRARMPSVPTTMPMMPPQEPTELRGLEGVMTPQGLWVTAVDGQARLSGVRVGDLVTNTNGQPIQQAVQLQQPFGGTFTVQRGGQRLQLGGNTMGAPPRGEARELDVRGVTGQITAQGLWIKSVGGEAARWGLRRGDLVRSINGQAVDVRRDARMLLRTLDPGAGVVFQLVRNGAQVYLPFDPAAPQAWKAGNPPSLRQAQAGHQDPGFNCPSCGAWIPASWASGMCWRCGNGLAAKAQPAANTFQPLTLQPQRWPPQGAFGVAR